MRLACETVVNEILPAVRSLMAKELKEEGYTQTEIAAALDLTQPAVSQYLNASRGRKVQRLEDDEEAYQAVQELVELVVDDAPSDEVSDALCDACLTIRATGVFGDVSGPDEVDGECLMRDA
ncbi:MAG: helix-turn-helix domain-containing protein [Candidatus Nanohaloarchaea archaeon]|nr:helix-turn-helix domain-containing protein [Candidatus Nanohaloarchaea archaeon]